MNLGESLLKKLNIALIVIIVGGNFLFNAFDAGWSWVIFNFIFFSLFIAFSTAYFLKLERPKRKKLNKNFLKLGIIIAALVGEFWLFAGSVVAYWSTPEYNEWLTHILYFINPLILFFGLPYLVFILFRFTNKFFGKGIKQVFNKKRIKFCGLILLLIFLYVLLWLKASETWADWGSFLFLP